MTIFEYYDERKPLSHPELASHGHPELVSGSGLGICYIKIY
jgi:hypothetical protein